MLRCVVCCVVSDRQHMWLIDLIVVKAALLLLQWATLEGNHQLTVSEASQERRKAIRDVICSPFNVKKFAASTLISLGADFIFVFFCVFFLRAASWSRSLLSSHSNRRRLIPLVRRSTTDTLDQSLTRWMSRIPNSAIQLECNVHPYHLISYPAPPLGLSPPLHCSNPCNHSTPLHFFFYSFGSVLLRRRHPLGNLMKPTETRYELGSKMSQAHPDPPFETVDHPTQTHSTSRKCPHQHNRTTTGLGLIFRPFLPNFFSPAFIIFGKHK